MENKQSAVGTQDNSMMKSVDQRARSAKGRSDLLTRRLKNRERQRRYRARKRQEAETKMPFVVEETAAVQAALQPKPNGNHNNFVSRIYCGRDWKKDARRAHVARHQEMNGSNDGTPTLTNVPEATHIAVANNSETRLDREVQPAGSSSNVNNETPMIVLGRRDWKAEARRKKNL